MILNKDGSFQRTLRFRGPDLESATEAELVAVAARVNNMLKRFGSGWALFFDAERMEALGYPDSCFPDAASWLVDKERQASFDGEREHFESLYHLTFLWLPPADAQASAEQAFVEGRGREKGRDWREALAAFIAETTRALDLLSTLMPEVRALGDEEALTFLHSAVSGKRGDPIWLPLSSQAVALLKERRAVVDADIVEGKMVSAFVFPSWSKAGHIRDARAPMELISALVGKHLSLHDLRRSFTNYAMRECLIEKFRVDLLTGHKPAQEDVTARAYLDLARLDWVQPEVQKIADWIEQQAAIAASKNVVPLRAAGAA